MPEGKIIIYSKKSNSESLPKYEVSALKAAAYRFV